MTDGLTDSMLDPVVNTFIREYAPDFLKVLNSRDIRKVITWLERKHREMIVPLVKEYPVLTLLEASAGQKTGELLGRYVVDKYETCSPAEKERWNSKRWLHHGAVGELLVIREMRKQKLFLVGLGRGLMNSDLQDKDEWHTQEYWKAKEDLEKMR